MSGVQQERCVDFLGSATASYIMISSKSVARLSGMMFTRKSQSCRDP